MDVTLLIADADAPCRHALARFFAHCGFSVHTAASAPECLEALHAIKPKILIADVDTLWGDGDPTATPNGEGWNFAHSPAVLVLGGAPADILARRAGVPRARCFPKPVQILRLIDAVCPLVAAITPRSAADAEEDSSQRSKEVITTC